MATIRIPVLGFGVSPDNSGDVFIEPSSVKLSNDLHNDLVVIFNDTATRIGLSGQFPVPGDFVDTAKLIVQWTSVATSGDVEWDVDYNPIAVGESIDPAAATRSVNQNDTAPGTTLYLLEAELTLTDGDFAANDYVKFTLYRDGTDAGDTMSDAAIVTDVFFQYNNA